MIEVRYNGPMLNARPKHFAEDDIDEIVATNASVHLEVLSNRAVMLIVEDDERVVHTTIYHAGRVPIRVQMKEEYRHGGKALMNNQDQPYAYLARPHWERDDVKVFPDLESLVTRCDDVQTFPGPGSIQVMAVFRDGDEVKVPREAYSVPDPVSKTKAKDFIRWRSDPDASSTRKVCGLFRANPDSPFEEQVAQYIETSPWRWKTSAELASSDAVSHGGNAL